MSNKKKIKKSKGNGAGNKLPQLKEALKQLDLSVPQAMAMLQEMKVTNLQLKVTNNALVGVIKDTFDDFGERLEALEKKVFGTAQGAPPDITDPSIDAITLPTEQAEKDAELLRRIQEGDKEEKAPPAAKSVPLGGPVGEPEEEVEDDPGLSEPSSGSMFPKA